MADLYVELEALHQVASMLNGLLTDQFSNGGPLTATQMANSTASDVTQMHVSGQIVREASFAGITSNYGELNNAGLLGDAHGAWMAAASALVAAVHTATDGIQQRMMTTQATYSETEANLHISTVKTTRGV